MSKKVSKEEDTITRLKKQENKFKKNQAKDEYEESSEEDEEQEQKDEIKEQSIKKTDKPRNLGELLNSMEESKPKQKKKPTVQKKNNDNGEPQKRMFYNSKGSGNADKIDKEAKISKNVYKNLKGLDNAAKENQKIKPTKDYLAKETNREYEENIAKPTFTSKKGKDENFVELNKEEDVSINIFFIFDVKI